MIPSSLAVLIAAQGTLIATVGDQANLILNVLTILFAVGVAIPALKSKRKDGTIKDLTDALAAKDAALKTKTDSLTNCELQKRQLEQAAVHIKNEMTASVARYNEMKQYTAVEAVKHFEETLEEHALKVELLASRHRAVIEQGEAAAECLRSIATTLERIEKKGFDETA